MTRNQDAGNPDGAKHISMELTADGARVTSLALKGKRLVLTIEAELEDSQLNATGLAAADGTSRPKRDKRTDIIISGMTFSPGAEEEEAGPAAAEEETCRINPATIGGPSPDTSIKPLPLPEQSQSADEASQVRSAPPSLEGNAVLHSETPALVTREPAEVRDTPVPATFEEAISQQDAPYPGEAVPAPIPMEPFQPAAGSPAIAPLPEAGTPAIAPTPVIPPMTAPEPAPAPAPDIALGGEDDFLPAEPEAPAPASLSPGFADEGPRPMSAAPGISLGSLEDGPVAPMSGAAPASPDLSLGGVENEPAAPSLGSAPVSPGLSLGALEADPAAPSFGAAPGISLGGSDNEPAAPSFGSAPASPGLSLGALDADPAAPSFGAAPGISLGGSDNEPAAPSFGSAPASPGLSLGALDADPAAPSFGAAPGISLGGSDNEPAAPSFGSAPASPGLSLGALDAAPSAPSFGAAPGISLGGSEQLVSPSAAPVSEISLGPDAAGSSPAPEAPSINLGFGGEFQPNPTVEKPADGKTEGEVQERVSASANLAGIGFGHEFQPNPTVEKLTKDKAESELRAKAASESPNIGFGQPAAAAGPAGGQPGQLFLGDDGQAEPKPVAPKHLSPLSQVAEIEEQAGGPNRVKTIEFGDEPAAAPAPLVDAPLPKPMTETWNPGVKPAVSEESSAVGGERHGEPQPGLSFGLEAGPAAEPAPAPEPAIGSDIGFGGFASPSPEPAAPPAPKPDAAPAPAPTPEGKKSPESGGTTVLIRYTCPKCKTQGMQAVDKVGTVVTCSNCGKAMRLVMKK